MAEMTDEARVVALDRLWPGDIADRSGELLDVVFGWADFARRRRQVAAQCADAGLTGTRSLAVNHELTYALRQPRVDACRNHL